MKRLFVVTLAAVMVGSTACHDTRAPVATTPSPTRSSEQPTINYFNSEPSTIMQGQSGILRWSVSNASSVEIDHAIGQVNSSDRKDILPTETTVYRLIASNAAGNVVATTTIKVDRPPAPPPSSAKDEALQHSFTTVNQQLKDVHFDYNSDDIRQDEWHLLEVDANVLKGLFQWDPTASVTVEGHCDERGSPEYNVALSDRRATVVKNALVKLGVPEDHLQTVGFGRERPLCMDETEQCYSQNRRAHFSTGHESSMLSK
jgi:peptidoglycan-associated lipoprotein